MSQKRQFEGADTESGTLYVVATPIGNLDDVSARALQVLEAVDVIACEDTRVTRKLLSAKGISTPTMAYHAHSGSDVQAKLLTRLEQGARLALVSDAGTPLISDPGAELVQATIDRGISVVPIPGPSASVGRRRGVWTSAAAAFVPRISSPRGSRPKRDSRSSFGRRRTPW